MSKMMPKKLLIAFIALGLVSLFADMTYEGARSVVGAYLEMLGATALIAGSVGIGEFLGYVTRGVGGFLAGLMRSSKAFWSLIYIGYAINLFAVPLLAFAGDWKAALLLVMVERIGKGLRTPARDTVLAEVTESIGRGKGFGIHELMDQIGAIAGPSIVLLAASYRGLRGAFLILAVPAIASLAMLTLASTSYPKVRAIEELRQERSSISMIGVKGLGKTFWLYVASTALLSLGFIHWSLFIYHVSYVGLIPLTLLPTLYIISMVSDAAIAFPAGYLYDRLGPKTLIVAPVLALITVPLLLQNKLNFIVTAAIIWGLVMGIYETTLRVFIADITRPENRSYAYGIYGMIYGLSWGVGNMIMGALYPVSSSYLIAYVILIELAALFMLLYTIVIALRVKALGE